MRMKKLAAALAALTLSSVATTEVLAQEWYAGIGIGQSGLDNVCEDGNLSGCDDTDTGWKIFGGYQIDDTWAVEVTYYDFEDIAEIKNRGGPANDANGEADAFNVSIKGNMPIANNFTAFAKIGVYRANIEFDFDTDTTVWDGEDETSTGVSWGLGMEYELSDMFGIRLEWEQLESVEGEINKGTAGIDAAGASQFEEDLDLISLSAVFNF